MKSPDIYQFNSIYSNNFFHDLYYMTKIEFIKKKP